MALDESPGATDNIQKNDGQIALSQYCQKIADAGEMMVNTIGDLINLNKSQGGIYICGAMKIGSGATVELFHLYLRVVRRRR